MPCVPGKLGCIGIGGYKKNGRAFMMGDGAAREREAVGLSVGNDKPVTSKSSSSGPPVASQALFALIGPDVVAGVFQGKIENRAESGIVFSKHYLIRHRIISGPDCAAGRF
jgi:hypothetical protein